MGFIIFTLFYFTLFTNVNAQTWSSIGQGIDEQVLNVASNSNDQQLYTSFYGSGVYMWDGISWTPIWELNDKWISSGSSMSIDGWVRSMCVYKDVLYAGGFFSKYDSIANEFSNLLMVSWDGTAWSDASIGNFGNVMSISIDDTEHALRVA